MLFISRWHKDKWLIYFWKLFLEILVKIKVTSLMKLCVILKAGTEIRGSQIGIDSKWGEYVVCYWFLAIEISDLAYIQSPQNNIYIYIVTEWLHILVADFPCLTNMSWHHYASQQCYFGACIQKHKYNKIKVYVYMFIRFFHMWIPHVIGNRMKSQGNFIFNT